MTGQRYRDGAPWANEVGYSRAVRVDGRIIVSGTIAVDDDGGVIAPDDAYEQALAAMEAVGEAIEELGGSPADVVRTRMYVTDADDWQAIGRAHRELFGEAAPATSMVEVAALVDEEAVVEVEAEAVVGV